MFKFRLFLVNLTFPTHLILNLVSFLVTTHHKKSRLDSIQNKDNMNNLMLVTNQNKQRSMYNLALFSGRKYKVLILIRNVHR